MSAATLRWITGGDTGISSKAIWAHMMTGNARGDRFGVGHPRDPADFGRCYRLLALDLTWRLRLPEMGEYSAEWAALAKHWDELEGLYDPYASTKYGTPEFDAAWRRMYERMREILDHARVCADCGTRGMNGWTTYPGDVKVCWRCEQKRKAVEPAGARQGDSA